MIPHFEPDAPNTISFVKYLVSELLKREPLKNGKTIILRTGEDSPYFPEFTDTLLEGVPYIKPDESVEEKGAFALSKLTAIYNYLLHKFKFHTTVLWPIGNNEFPLVLNIPMVINDPKGLYKMAEQLGLKPQTDLTPNHNNKNVPSRLKKNPLRIAIGNRESHITEKTLQSRLVEIMFEHEPNEIVELDELVDKGFGLDIINPSEKWKSVNNALYLVNERVKKDTGEVIFKLGKVRYSRIK